MLIIPIRYIITNTWASIADPGRVALIEQSDLGLQCMPRCYLYAVELT